MLAKHVNKYKANDLLAWFRIFLFVAQHFGAFFLYDVLPTPIFVFSHTVNLVQGFIIFHDMGHQSYFTSSKLNRVMEWVFSFAIITPVDWTVRHDAHHGRSGNLSTGSAEWNDTVFLTTDEYRALPPKKQTLYRVMREPIVFFVLAPIAVWEIQYRIPWIKVNPSSDGHDTPEVFNSLVNTFGAGLHLSFLYYQFGGAAFGWFFLGMYFGQVAGLLLFHTQHSFNPSYNAREGWNRKDSATKGSSFQTIPSFLKFWTMGIEYHHIHHYTTKVPGYYLQKCHEEAPAGMWSDLGVVELTYSDMWKGLGYTLYDEAENKFLTFAEFNKSVKSNQE